MASQIVRTNAPTHPARHTWAAVQTATTTAFLTTGTTAPTNPDHKRMQDARRAVVTMTVAVVTGVMEKMDTLKERFPRNRHTLSGILDTAKQAGERP